MTVQQEKCGKREQKKIKARNEILNAAVVQFSEKGFIETSIADIMNAADMGLGTFYNYFSSKEDVLRNLLNSFSGTLSYELKKLVENNSTSKTILTEMVMHTTRLVSKNRYLLPLLFTGAMVHTKPRGDKSVDMPAPEFMGTFLRIIKDGQEKGEFRKDVTAEIISEMFHSMFQTAAFSHLKFSFEENIEMKLRLLIDGISVCGK